MTQPVKCLFAHETLELLRPRTVSFPFYIPNTLYGVCHFKIKKHSKYLLNG